jgi:hypothetical protein
VLLNEPGVCRLPANFRVRDFRDVSDNPAKHRQILIDGLGSAIVVMPDFGAGRVDIANRGHVAALDRFEQPIRDLKRLFAIRH